MTPMTSFLLGSLMLTSSVAAQRTWIVDQFGPGDFKDLPEAFEAASPADNLIVKPGFYRGASTNKGIRVYSIGAFVPSGVIEVYDLPRDETFVIDSFSSAPTGTQLLFRNCRGTIYVGPFEQSYTVNPHPTPSRVTIESCDNVVFHHCWLHDVRIKSSTVLFSDCVIRGMAIPWPVGDTATPALTVGNSHVTMIHPNLDGALGQHTATSTPPPPPGVEMRGGTLILAGEGPCA